MFIQTAFNFSSVVQRLICRFSGLRLLAFRQFLVFLASSPCAAIASSYCFCSAVRLRSILFLPLWLTGQSSRPAFGRRLTFFR